MEGVEQAQTDLLQQLRKAGMGWQRPAAEMYVESLFMARLRVDSFLHWRSKLRCIRTVGPRHGRNGMTYEMISNMTWYELNYSMKWYELKYAWYEMVIYDRMVRNELWNDCMKWLYEMIVWRDCMKWLYDMRLFIESWRTLCTSFGSCRWLNRSERRYSWYLLILFALIFTKSKQHCQPVPVFCKQGLKHVQYCQWRCFA